MDQLRTEIPRVVDQQGRDRDLILLIRHAHRERIVLPTVEAAFGAQLTERGRRQSLELGRQLEVDRPVRLFFSPVQRCEDTARCLAEGLESHGGETHVVGARPFLGARFVKDGRRMVQIFADVGLRGFVDAWARGALDPEVIEDHKQAGRRLLLDLVGEHLPGEGAPLDIHVSHDITVLALMGLFLDLTSPEIPWPEYLDGAVLGLQRERITWWYRGLQGEIPMATVKSWTFT
jgi:broad specificity phosphatase PhoE